MTSERAVRAVESIEGVCEVEVIQGPRAVEGAPCDVLVELPHGATEAAHIEGARGLTADYPAGYDDVFWVNTDQGSPEYGRRFAQQITDPTWVEEATAALLTDPSQRAAAVEAAATRKVLVVRALVPRTIVDLNRVWEVDAATFREANLTGASAPFARPEELEAIHARYLAYQQVADAAHAQVCGAGGRALNLHTYAPITVSLQSGETLLDAVRKAYIPQNYPSYPKRPPAQLITRLPSEEPITDAPLAALLVERYAAAEVTLSLDDPFTMHKATACYVRAAAYPGQVTVLELRRDTLTDAFTPFAKWPVSAARVEAMTSPLSLALVMRAARG
jgi:hypothetical protein